jgi:hypothetical protein
MIAVTQESETVYEGSLTVDGEDEPYSVVVIYQPDENSLLVNILKQIVFILIESVFYKFLLSWSHCVNIFMCRILIG